MSMELVKAEIHRFLESPVPEVLCVRGKWGVGKTYAWLHYLKEVASRQRLGLKKYSYSSLFGLNSLDSLRFSIFESTVPEALIESGPNIDSLRDALRSAGAIGRSAKSLAAPLLSLVGMSNTEETLARATFFSVRNQIICFDDLERAGSDLDIRDVLGLASMLKEQRGCKVVLLLNDEKLSEEKREDFNRLLEKVVDTSLIFEPSPEEAVEIALDLNDDINRKLSENIVKIGITNIRVIKKIERLSRRIAETLAEFRSEVLESSIKTATLAGWSTFQPDVAPTPSFLKRFNRDVDSVRERREGAPELKEWAEKLESFGYRMSDDMDVVIIEGFERGYFDETRLISSARELQKSIENDRFNNSFSRSWDSYHHSLVDDDEEILEGIYQGAMENLATTSPSSINATVKLLREFNREEQASNLVKNYMDVRKFGLGVIKEEFRIWGNEPLDPEFEAACQKIDEEYVDNRDPKEVLCKIAERQSWNEEDIALLAKQDPENYENIFESIQGPDLSRAAKFAVRLGKHEGENYKAMGDAAEAGLRRIASKSPLKAKRVASYGVEVA